MDAIMVWKIDVTTFGRIVGAVRWPPPLHAFLGYRHHAGSIHHFDLICLCLLNPKSETFQTQKHVQE